MTSIEEGYLRFEFGPEWLHVEQWDKTSAFARGVHGVDGVRALDIIALSDVECGTLAGMVGAASMQETRYAGEFINFLAAHKSKGLKVRVVLWVEGKPTSKGISPRSKPSLLALTQSLKRKIKWLTSKPVQVLSTESPPTLPGVEVFDTRG